uniref:Ankyrin repeat domain 61 n=1 Tax=Esox lucius TaxID=8010 RepID=A0A6Q2XQJ2_ESOLU
MESTVNSSDGELYDAILTEDLCFLYICRDMYIKHSQHIFLIFYNMFSLVHCLQGLAILPLHLAACYRKAKSLESLLSAGADPDIRDLRGRNTLHLVITHWPSMLAPWPKASTGFEMAMTSVQRRAEDCIRVLCSHGVNVNAEVDSDSRHTALHLAVRYGASPAIGVLVSHSAKINAVDHFGMTPLHMAAGILNTGMTARLIQLGADVNKVAVVSKSGNSPLHLASLAACSRPGQALEVDVSCITELLDQGADPDIVNHAGHTSLHEACIGGCPAVVECHLKYGANINRLTISGENCLFLFLDQKLNLRHTSLLEKLLNLTYPLTITNRDGQLPSTLMLPQYLKQRDQLLNLSRQPRSLMDIAKIHIYQLYGSSAGRESLKQVLPDKMHHFVFHH